MEKSLHCRDIEPVRLASTPTLVIVGKGPYVRDTWSHLSELLDRKTQYEACGINSGWWELPDQYSFTHWFTLHPNLFYDYPNSHAIKHTITLLPDMTEDSSLANYRWPITALGDSSLVATILALNVWGYKKVILTGVPLNTFPYTDFQDAWRVHGNYVKDKVRSTHGWTMDLFGYPSNEWIRG